MSIEIGNVKIFRLVEVDAGNIIQGIIKEASSGAINSIEWLYPDFVDKNGNLKAVVQSFLIKSKGKNILIDTCNGNDKSRKDLEEWSNLQTNFIENLYDIGMSPEDVDIVICTHLHTDHVGWNTKLSDGRWVPTFQNARYIFVKDEYDYWRKYPEKELYDDKAAFDDSVAPIVNAGRAEFVEETYSIDNNLTIIPTPGHTLHHSSIFIESRGKKAVIIGDLFHHPCQIANLEWVSDGDALHEKTIESRKRILHDIANTENILIGSHFSKPFGFVKSINNEFIFVPVE